MDTHAQELERRIEALERSGIAINYPLKEWKDHMFAATDEERQQVFAALVKQMGDCMHRIGFLEGLQQGKRNEGGR